MKETNETDEWVFVIISDTDGNEKYLGLYDENKKTNFIPVFRNKDDADSCFMMMSKKKGQKYEIQAVLMDELLKDIVNNEFYVAIVDGDGKILEIQKQEG